MFKLFCSPISLKILFNLSLFLFLKVEHEHQANSPADTANKNQKTPKTFQKLNGIWSCSFEYNTSVNTKHANDPNSTYPVLEDKAL
jgi:hypothetical protein